MGHSLTHSRAERLLLVGPRRGLALGCWLCAAIAWTPSPAPCQESADNPSAAQAEAPQSPEALLRQARDLEQSGRIADAARAYAEFSRRFALHAESPVAATRAAELEALLALQAEENKLRQETEKVRDNPSLHAQRTASLASFYTAHGKFAEARETWLAILSQTPHTREGFDAPCRVAALLEREGRPTEALEAWQHAIGSHDERLQRYQQQRPASDVSSPNAGYFANRTELDAAAWKRSALARVIALAQATDKSDIADTARQQLSALAQTRKTDSSVLTHAASLIADAQAEQSSERRVELLRRAALECLSALEFPPFVPREAKPLLPENAAQLRTLGQRLDPVVVNRAVSLLQQAAGLSKADGAISASPSPTSTEKHGSIQPSVAWVVAADAVSQGALEDARRVLSKMQNDAEGDLAGQLARYGVGLIYACEGRYPEAVQEFRKAARSAILALSAECQTADALFRQGLYQDAADISRRALLAMGESTSSARGAILYRLGQSHEFQGEFRQARGLYQQLVDVSGVDPELTRLARCAVARLSGLRDAAGEAMATAQRSADQICTYMGENRDTRGEWHRNYGSEAYILCGMLSPQDITGVRGQRAVPSGQLRGLPLQCRFTTTRSGENGRRWLSQLDDPGGPSLALWNPISLTWSAAAWDDFGEQLPPGQGDLVVHMEVPDGLWRLSLAFVNDHNYFENSRRYTIHVTDAQRRFLTGCEVSDFLTPLYKHFAVRGPAGLTVHVYRDASLNTLLSGIFLDPLFESLRVPEALSALLSLTPASQEGGAENVRDTSPATAALTASGEALPDRVAALLSLAADYRRQLADAPPNPGDLPPVLHLRTLWHAFELDTSLGFSAAAPQEALDRISQFLARGHKTVAVNDIWGRVATDLHSTGRERAARIVDMHRCRLVARADGMALLHLSGAMVNELWPRDRPLARTLFAQAIRVLEHRGTPNQRHEVLLGVLKNEVREGRWDLAASVLARIKESNRGEHPLALEVKELAARTLAGRHDYLNAAMTLGEIIAQKEALTREFPDDRLSRELPDNRFMLVCQYAAAGRIREAEAALERAENCLNPDRIANLHHLVGVRELDVNPRSPRSGSHFRYILKKYPDTRWAKLAAAGLKVIGNPEGPSGPSDP